MTRHDLATLQDARRQLRLAEAQARSGVALLDAEGRARVAAEGRADAAERQVVALRSLVETLADRLESFEADTLLEPPA